MIRRTDPVIYGQAKADKQLKKLHVQMGNATSKKEMKRIKKKMENIRKDAEKKFHGEEHSRGNKR